MVLPLSRRQFVRDAAALSLAALVPKRVPAQSASAPASALASSSTQRVLVHPDVEIGLVRPEFHGHFAEHLGSCIYGGLWVGKNSSIPNINGYRKQAVEYLRELGVPVLRWPGGCFADDYHWRDGIGPQGQRPQYRTLGFLWGTELIRHDAGMTRDVGEGAR